MENIRGKVVGSGKNSSKGDSKKGQVTSNIKQFGIKTSANAQSKRDVGDVGAQHLREKNGLPQYGENRVQKTSDGSSYGKLQRQQQGNARYSGMGAIHKSETGRIQQQQGSNRLEKIGERSSNRGVGDGIGLKSLFGRMTKEELLDVACAQRDEIAKLQRLLNQTTAAAAAASAAAASAAAANRNISGTVIGSEDVNPLQGRHQQTFVIDSSIRKDSPGRSEARERLREEQRGLAFEHRSNFDDERGSGSDVFFDGGSSTTEDMESDPESANMPFSRRDHTRHPSLGRRKGKVEICNVQVQVEVTMSSASIQVGRMDVSGNTHVSVIVADCLARITQSLESINDTVLTVIRSHMSGDSLKIKDEVIHECTRKALQVVLREIVTMEYELEQSILSTREYGVASAFQKYVFMLYIEHPRSVIESLFKKIDKDMLDAFDPIQEMNSSTNFSSLHPIVTMLQDASNKVRGRVLRMERHLTTSLTNIVEDVNVLCTQHYRESTKSLKIILEKLKEGIDDMKLLRDKRSLSEYRLENMLKAMQAADSSVSNSFLSLRPSLEYAMWEAAAVGPATLVDLKNTILRSRNNIINAIASTSKVITIALHDADSSATNGMARILFEARQLVAKWEAIILEMSIGLAVAGEGFTSSMMASIHEGGRLLAVELLTCSHIVHSLLSAMMRDDAAWLSSTMLTADAISLELNALKAFISRCEENGRRIMTILVKSFQRGILSPRIVITGDGEREMPSIEVRDKIKSHDQSPKDPSGIEISLVDHRMGSILGNKIKALIIQSLEAMSTSTRAAAKTFSSSIENDCLKLLEIRGSSYPTLEDGLKQLLRSMKVVKRHFEDGVDSIAQGASHIFKDESVALRRRIAPAPPHVLSYHQKSNLTGDSTISENTSFFKENCSFPTVQEQVDSVVGNRMQTFESSKSSTRRTGLQNIFTPD